MRKTLKKSLNIRLFPTIYSHTKNLSMGIYPCPIPKPEIVFDTEKNCLRGIGYEYWYDNHTQYTKNEYKFCV